jgi:hypothetical protein
MSKTIFDKNQTGKHIICGCEITRCSRHWFDYLDHPEKYFEGHLPAEACDASCRHPKLEDIKRAIEEATNFAGIETAKEVHGRIMRNLLD